MLTKKEGKKLGRWKAQQQDHTQWLVELVPIATPTIPTFRNSVRAWILIKDGRLQEQRLLSLILSDLQERGVIIGSKLKLVAAIDNHSEVRDTSKAKIPFRIVDLGCSVGPNTFVAINDIIEAMEQKHQGASVPVPEFQVFFNDHVTNDFNVLFTSLPADRRYFAAGVPGSFHGRLFPKSSLDFVYSSNSLHWLSSIPKEIQDPNSTCFNKGRIYYMNAPEDVGEAYSKQFAKDMESFLFARSQELVPGGLMVLLFAGRPSGTLPSDASLGPFYLPLERCLVEMANEGLLSKHKVDTFNFPMYNPSPEELTLTIEKNGCFDIKEMESSLVGSPVPYLPMQTVRAGSEGLITSHFGDEIVDELFDRYADKISGLPHLTAADGTACPLFVVLKRKP